MLQLHNFLQRNPLVGFQGGFLSRRVLSRGFLLDVCKQKKRNSVLRSFAFFPCYITRGSRLQEHKWEGFTLRLDSFAAGTGLLAVGRVCRVYIYSRASRSHSHCEGRLQSAQSG